jgi:hypothetical protein
MSDLLSEYVLELQASDNNDAVTVGIVIAKMIADNLQLRAAVGRLEGERDALREACEKIKAKSEMWQQVAQSTASAKAIPPWWNLGYIAAAALEKAAALAADGERGTG